VILKVTMRSWSEMRQVTEIKQATSHTTSTVTAMFHGSIVGFTGLKPFCGSTNGQATSHHSASLDSNVSLWPSLSQNLTGKPAITESRSRYRRAALPLSKSFAAVAPSAISARLVLEADPTKSGQWAPKLNNAARTEQLSCVQA